MTDDDLEAFEREVAAALEASHEAFMGKYKAELEALAGLSREDIDSVTPGGVDLQKYDALVAVVKEASRRHMAQAALKERIEALGEVAVKIAKKVPSLAALFA